MSSLTFKSANVTGSLELLFVIMLFLEGESFKGKDCRAWVMPWYRSVNMDTVEDMLFAEWLTEKGLVK